MNGSAFFDPKYGGKVVLLTILFLAATMLVVNLLPTDTKLSLVAEMSFFETLSALGYLVSIALMLALWGLRETARRWYLAAGMALLAARELDLDKRPFTEGLLKSRQYVGDTVAGTERLVAVLILLAILCTVITLLWRETKAFLQGLYTKEVATYAAFYGFALIVGTKLIDGAARKLEPFGIILSESAKHTALIVEEVGEMGIAIMFALSIILAAANKKETR